MTSLQTSMKQSKGYFVTTGTGCLGYTLSGTTGAGGGWVPGVMTVLAAGGLATSLATTGVVLRDMGKTVVTTVTGQTQAGRVFRKVQLLNQTRTLGSSVDSNGVNGSSAVAGSPQTGYYTCYIELPSPGSSGSASTPAAAAAPVAYIPGMPVF